MLTSVEKLRKIDCILDKLSEGLCNKSPYKDNCSLCNACNDDGLIELKGDLDSIYDSISMLYDSVRSIKSNNMKPLTKQQIDEIDAFIEEEIKKVTDYSNDSVLLEIVTDYELIRMDINSIHTRIESIKNKS